MSRILHKIIHNIEELLHICVGEFRMILHDAGASLFFIFLPLGYPLIYSFIYTNEVVRNVPVAVVDDSRSALSRTYLRHLDGTPDVQVLSYCNDMEEARNMMNDHDVYGIVYIPRSFSRDLMQGKQVGVSIYCDMSALLYYRAILMANTNVSLAMNSKIKMERSGNTTNRQDEIAAYPVRYEDISIFNPTNGFAVFLIPAVLMLIIQQSLLLGIGLVAGTAREGNLYHELVPFTNRPNSVVRLVVGKSICYVMIYSVMAAHMLCFVPWLFKLNQLVRPLDLAFFMLPYLLACIFFAMTVSAAIRNRETTLLIFVFTSVPLLFLSGISWPETAIPPFWRYFSYLFPSTFGINGFVKLNNMGATLQEIRWEYISLWVQVMVYFMTACLSYYWQRRISWKRQMSSKPKTHVQLNGELS